MRWRETCFDPEGCLERWREAWMSLELRQDAWSPGQRAYLDWRLGVQREAARQWLRGRRDRTIDRARNVIRVWPLWDRRF
jgi:hypothetical protein